MYSENVTFVIFTYNEEARIERAVRNFGRSGQVLVVDNHSTDRTREVAEKAGARILVHKNPGWVEDENTVSSVKAAVTTPWIYWGFADEMIDAPTMAVILETIASGDCSIINIARKNYYYGKFCQGAYADTLNRVFIKSAIDFIGNTIHSFGRPTVPESAIRRLDPSRYFVHHFISDTAGIYFRKINIYSDVESKIGPSDTVLKIALGAMKGFLGNYIFRKGCKGGLSCFFFVVQQVYYRVLVNMKRYEANQGLNFATIEERNNVVRDQLLRTFK